MKPSLEARMGSKRSGQPATMRVITGSGSRRIARRLRAGDAFERGDLLGDRDADAGHRERAPRPDGARIHARRMQEEVHPQWRRMRVTHGFGHRQHHLLAGERLTDDVRKEPERDLLGMPGAEIVGKRKPTP